MLCLLRVTLSEASRTGLGGDEFFAIGRAAISHSPLNEGAKVRVAPPILYAKTDGLLHKSSKNGQ